MKIMKAYNLSSVDVMLVDDHMATIYLMRQILRALGIREIRVARNVDAALKVSDKFSPDIIFCDFKMPGKNGLELIKKIRLGGSKWNPQIPIILFTSFTEENMVCKLRDAGASDILAKPVSPASIYSKIANTINSQKQFINVADYIGPDRRRKNNKTPFADEDRRMLNDDGQKNHEGSLSQEELDVLFEKTD